MNALVLVDIQNDFLPTGALPVPGGDEVIEPANALMSSFNLIVATQDWHPRDHGSFAVNHPGKRPGDVIDLHGLQQILWPAHCVQNTPGATFAPGLDMTRVAQVFRKGTDPTIDSYSGFFDNGHRKATGLGDYLKTRGVTDVYLCGLAIDYCVKFSALDAVKLGFRAHLIRHASRGVNLRCGDVDRAIEDMREAGVEIVTGGTPVAVAGR
jgi:nicotinamidase/pyrazinamidase